MDKNQREAGDRPDRGVPAEGRRLEKGLILLANLRGRAIGTSLDKEGARFEGGGPLLSMSE